MKTSSTKEKIIDAANQPIRWKWIPFLKKAIDLGKIAPGDIDIFICFAIYYAFCAVKVSRNSMGGSKEQWVNGLDMIFSLLKTKKDWGKRL